MIDIGNLLFAYINIFDSHLPSNYGWILREAGIGTVEWLSHLHELDPKTKEEEYRAIQEIVSNVLNENLKLMIEKEEDQKKYLDGVNFKHDPTTGEKNRVSFKVKYRAVGNWVILDIEDQANPHNSTSLDLPHTIGDTETPFKRLENFEN